MLTGSHVVIYTKDAESDRAFFRDVLGLRSVDAGHGWLIFALPAAEAAFHPFEENNKHEMYFICDDLGALMASLAKKGVRFGGIAEEQWGTRTRMLLPGGGEVGLYQPKHPVTFKRVTKAGKGSARKKAKRSRRRA